MTAIPRKQRAMVRKGIQHGPDFRDRSRYRAPAITRSTRKACAIWARRSFAPRYTQLLQKVFGDDCEILTVMPRGPGGCERAELLLPRRSAAVLRRRLGARTRVAGNDFMYWEVMRARRGTRAAAVRLRPQQARHRLVRLQGALGLRAGAALLRVLSGASARDVPEVNPTNPKYRLMIALWQRLPLWLTRLIGPLTRAEPRMKASCSPGAPPAVLRRTRATRSARSICCKRWLRSHRVHLGTFVDSPEDLAARRRR